jgi:type IV secretion/conjugal transfer VirB4 family ATPase
MIRLNTPASASSEVAVINVGRVLKDYQESGAFHALVGIQAAIDDGVFVTKVGDLVMLVAVQGIDYECLDPEEIDQVARRFESALRTLDERFRIYQYVLRREEPYLPFQHHDDPVVEGATASRLRYLASKNLCSMENFLAIVYEGWRPGGHRQIQAARWLMEPRAAFRELLSERENSQNLQRELDLARELLKNKAASFVIQLRDFLAVEILDSQRAFTVLRRLLNYAPFKVEGVHLKYNSFVDFQACDSSLECHRDFLRLDDYHVQVLTLKEPPARTFAHLLRGLGELPANYVICTEWKREPAHKVRSLIQSKRRHFHNSKASLLNYVNASGQAAPRDMLIDDGAVAVVANLGASLEEIELQGRYFGQFSLTVILYHKDVAVLRRSVAQAFKVFATHDAQLTEEHYNRLNAWLAVLPGNGAYNVRRLWLLNTNYADLSFLYTLHTGQARNEHLGKEYLAIFEGTGGTPFFLNLHSKDVAHSVVLGATGSGKSFLLNFLLTHLQKYEPTTFIFDLGGSYESLTRLFKGSYLPIGHAERPFAINPFALTPTKENLLFLFAFVKVLIESNGYRATAEEERDLYEQIENLYAVAADQRRLFTLSNILPRNLRAQLQKWVQGGPYASLFDNAEDHLSLARFQTFDFEGMDKFPDQLEPLLFYVLHRANVSIYDEAQPTFKVFVIDEAWRFFRNPVIKAYIVEALKTWRKKNAAMILATQSSDDLLTSEILPVVVESCPTKFFLSNPGMDGDAYRRVFHLNETETDLIRRLIPKQQLLFKQPALSKLLNLNVDSKEYWIYTNNPPDNRRRREAFERHGFQEGLEALVRGNA